MHIYTIKKGFKPLTKQKKKPKNLCVKTVGWDHWREGEEGRCYLAWNWKGQYSVVVD
jgi:hypothetical protein